jgi:HEAT repeat protein
VRFRAVELLAARQDPRVEPALLEGLAGDATLARTCGQALAARGVLQPLLELIPASPPWRFLAIAAALGRIDHPAARQALLAMVGHPDQEVDAAIMAHGPALVRELGLVLADEAWGRRWHAALLLGGIGDRAAAVPLLPLVEDAHLEVRLAAIAALAQLRDPVALSDLVACAKDPSWRVRAAAIEALGRLGVPEARPVLEAALHDPRLEVRDAAMAALDGGQAPA